MELTVLGCSGSYGGVRSSACSGYLVRAGDTSIWLDCGNGTFGNLQRHLEAEDLTAVVLTHQHPDHCVDLYGLYVLARYGLGREGIPVYGPSGIASYLAPLVGGTWDETFAWHPIDDGSTERIGDVTARFSRTDHPPPTYAVDLEADGRRLVYTADTGPDWSVGAFAPGADLVLSEATYLEGKGQAPIHLTAAQAGAAALDADARRLMLTHLWPRLDPETSEREASRAFGAPVEMAIPHLVTAI